MEHAKNSGDGDGFYNGLSLHLLEQAHIQNRLHDVSRALTQLQADALEIETIRRAEYHQSLDSLVATDSLDPEQYIARYRDILMAFGEKEDEDFLDQMLALRAKLVLGTVILVDNEIVTVTPSVGDTSASPDAVLPVLERSEAQQRYIFSWSVATSDHTTRVNVTDTTIVGYDAVTDTLIDNYDLLRIKESSPVELLAIAGRFRVVNEHEMAERFQQQAIHRALDELDQSSDSDLGHLVQALEIVDSQPGRLEQYLDDLAREIAREQRLGHNLEAVRAVLAYTQLESGEIQDNGDLTVDLEEVIGLYLELANRGEDLQ